MNPEEAELHYCIEPWHSRAEGKKVAGVCWLVISIVLIVIVIFSAIYLINLERMENYIGIGAGLFLGFLNSFKHL